jgi:hypothetical protein
VADDGDPLPLPHAERVEAGGDRARPPRQLAVGQLADRGGGLGGLVDDADPVAVHQLGPIEEVTGGQGDAHAGSRAQGPRRPAAVPGTGPLDVVAVTLTGTRGTRRGAALRP